LALLPGALTPSLQEDLVRLGVWMPFGRAAQELAYFRHTVVSRPTAERLTEAAGAAYVAVQTAEVGRLEREAPEAPAGPAKLFLSADGAMVPLVGGEWAEVKTLVLGEVQPAKLENGELVVHTHRHSYFSRLADVETFQRLALVETQRRGVETAGAVAAVTDGSEWIQKFVDHHSYRALRILDFPHAGEHIHAVGQAHWGEGSAQAQVWLAEQLHALKHRGPAPVLSAVRCLVGEQPEHHELATHLAYLEKREAHMQYPVFQAAGWPIGDGAVESANKLVVEARLKGSGMHWTRAHVDPMLALRNIVCNDRWDEAWPQITTQLRQQAQQRRMARHQQRRPAAPSQPGPAPQPSPVPPLPAASTSNNLPSSASPPKSSSGTWRPPANHPWRHMPVGRARFKPSSKQADAKT
jgi:hypothetical protein